MAIYITKGLYASGALASGDYTADNPIIGYRNNIAASGITADSEQTNYPATNIANVSTAEYWWSDSTALQYVEFNFTSTTVDFIAVAAHNLVGSTYQFQYKNGAGGTWTDIDDARVAPDNSAIMWYFEDITADYFRIKITPDTGVKPKIGVVYIGEVLRLQRRVYDGHTPINYGRGTKVMTGMSENSDFLGRVVMSRVLQSSLEQKNVTAAFYRNNIESFINHADIESKPYFLAWRPSTYPLEIGYCWNTANIVPQNSGSNGMMSFSLKFKAHAPWV